MRVAICISTFNRVEVTRKCLDLIPRALPIGVTYHVYATDGGSSDGTISHLAGRAEVELLEAPGTYWNRGMFSSIERALATNPDFLLLLNDDVFLRPGSLEKMLERAVASPGSILVGETMSTEKGGPITGRIKRVDRLSRIAMTQMAIGEVGEAITFHGNCVLLPTEVMRLLGNLDPYFIHALGDTDLGLRATRLGIPIYSIGEAVGTCLAHRGSQLEGSRLSWKFWQKVFFDPKLVPVNEWLYFCRRHSGPLWPLNFIARYLRLAVKRR